MKHDAKQVNAQFCANCGRRYSEHFEDEAGVPTWIESLTRNPCPAFVPLPLKTK